MQLSKVRIHPVLDESNLYKHVRCWVNNQRSNDGYKSVQDVLKEVLEHGCQSGIVGHLIYYNDTKKFYKKYRDDISSLLEELIEDTGLPVSGLFGNKWDDEDPLANHTTNQNLLAWFGFEETARQVARDINLDY